jgi:hypothetical protein
VDGAPALALARRHRVLGRVCGRVAQCPMAPV